MNNKVFYQHPNLMRVLGMHETVMEVMVNVLGGDKSQVSVSLRQHILPLQTFTLKVGTHQRCSLYTSFRKRMAHILFFNCCQGIFYFEFLSVYFYSSTHFTFVF